MSVPELADCPIISMSVGSSTFDFYSKEFLKYNCHFSPDIEAATADQILPLVKHGLGIGFVPEQFLEGEEGLRTISLTEALPEREIALVKKSAHSLPQPAKELVKMLNQEYVNDNF